jgi:hypothetical protein
MGRTILAVVAGLLAMALLTGWGRQQLPPNGAPDPDAARLVAVLAREGALLSPPADLRLGPGDCSSPLGDAGQAFDGACARHDHGYALLRYAAGHGRPLSTSARAAIDDRFRADLRRSCTAASGTDRATCRFAAAGYGAAVGLNSWRQGFGVPIREGCSTLVAALAGGTATMLLLAPPWRRRVPPELRRVAGHRGDARSRSAAPTVGAPVAGAVLGLALSLQPSMLPRPLWVQALIGGVLAAHGYAAGAVVRALSRAGVGRALPWVPTGTHQSPDGPRLRAAGARLAPLALALLLAAAVGRAAAGQAELALLTSPGAAAGDALPTAQPALQLAGLVAAAAVGAALVTLGRRGGDWLRRGILTGIRTLSRRRRTTTVAVATSALLVMGGGLTAAARPVDAGPVAADAVTDGVTTGLEAAGGEARAFLAGTPEAAQLATTGRPAVRPLRIYVPSRGGTTPADAARAAADALDRAGAFDRRALLVALPTGSGWVNPDAPAALERIEGGDVATVAVQYASAPSWLAYLLGGLGAQDAARALFAAIAQRLDERAAAHPGARRPRVLVYGESLGAWSGLVTTPRNTGLPQIADGALWAGVPADVQGDLRTGDQDGRVLALDHVDDPVAAWSPKLLVRPSQRWTPSWLPLVSFWLATGDVITARQVPDGHGHVYGRELEGAWRTILGSPL